MTPPTKSALVVRGGWDGHVPVEATDSFVPFLERSGYAVRIEDSPAAYADPELMAGIDLVVQCVTMSTIEPEELRGLRRAVESGTGLAGWHGGIADSYRNSSDYLHLIGGQFACHPGKDPATITEETAENNFIPHRITIRPEAAEHPIVAGVQDFDLVTEQYWVLTDDYIDVLATTTQQVRPWDPWQREVTSPAIWTRQWGRGRIFVATPGHSMDVLNHESVRSIIERGLLWASRAE
jgi:type 1 glutamine amidotransferase